MIILEPASEEDAPWLDLARDESEKSKMSRFRLGAILVKRGKIIGFGYNKAKSHPKWGSGKFKTLHSEGDAIYCALRLGNDPKDAIMYVYRENWNLSKPCADCLAHIQKVKIKKVIYSNGIIK